MEEEAVAGCRRAGELLAGSLIPVLLEQVVDGTLVVSFQCGQQSFRGILLESKQKSGLFCIPPSLQPKQEDPPASTAINIIHEHVNPIQQQCNMELRSASGAYPTKNADQVPPLVPPPGTLLSHPPYFEGAPFPPPIWLRHSYNQWVPQPPPRTIRTKRRLSRNRDSGRLIMSTIRLRPRQILCEKCKNTLNPENDDKDSCSLQTLGSIDIQSKDEKKPDEREDDEKKSKNERKEVDIAEELVPRSPVIKISFSTPQGKGEVVEIPSRVHGSVKPFCPKRILQNGDEDQQKHKNSEKSQETSIFDEKCESSSLSSIPKLKLTRPMHSSIDAPPPKIRLKPHRLTDGDGVSVYKAELINKLNIFHNRKESDAAMFYTQEATERVFGDVSSGSSGEDDDFKGFPHHKNGHGNLTLLMDYRKRNRDSSGLSVGSNDSLDESSKSSSSEFTSPEMSDFLPCEDVSVSSSSKDGHKIVPPLTVRLHTKCVSRCVTEEGNTFSIGDIVWGKIHGFPWWPACILSISTSHKENGEPCWQEAKVSWFGNPTTSFLSVSKLSSFCEFFNLRFNRKKKGLYRKAITEAAKAVEHLNPEIREILMQCET
ncbi:PWWP domain-containing protein 2B [Ambystoma mexicanum]|uniref:PWWP domain-containing protein 2B n=1 Tax=Ambystoma mexicanum TaxID=8296 RepID=UPI0037E7A776